MTATATARFTASGPWQGPPPEAAPDAPRGQGAHFTTVATAVVRGRVLGLTTTAKLLYVVLRSYAGPNGTCFPGYARLQNDVGCGINQLTRAMGALETAGLVTRRRRGQGKPTLYTVHAPDVASHASQAEPPQFHSRSESRVAAGVNQESPERRVEQDSGDLDPEDHHQQAPPSTDGDERASAVDDALLASLTEHGISSRIAVRLVKCHDAQAVQEQLAWHAYRPAAKNPAGSLVRAIQERWPAPPAWLEAQEHAAAVTRQTEADATRQAEEATQRQEWEARPPEERIAGRLQFWLIGQQRKRQEPTAAEIAAKRAALLAELTDVTAQPFPCSDAQPPAPRHWPVTDTV